MKQLADVAVLTAVGPGRLGSAWPHDSGVQIMLVFPIGTSRLRQNGNGRLLVLEVKGCKPGIITFLT